MKTRILAFVAFLAIVLAPTGSLAATQGVSPTHGALDGALTSAIQFAQRLHGEVRKGKKMDAQAAKQEIANLRQSLESAKLFTEQVVAQKPSESSEGHYVALRNHQETAVASLDKVERSLDQEKPDLSMARKSSKNVLNELKDAKREHAAELKELEASPHP